MTPTIIPYIIPILLLLFVVEIIYSYKEEMPVYKRKDTINNIVVGVGFVIVTMFSKGITFFAFQYVYQYRLINLSEKWYIWIIAVILADFAYYIYHRASHEVSWFWASHVVHHSSEEYNVSVAFRLPWITNIAGHFIFWIWIPLLGFHPFIAIIAQQVVALYQGILHTKLIGKLHPIIEFIFNTPSHHRVHHGSNLEYLDKNHGGMFIIWDRLFRTFKEEDAEPVYGLTTKLDSSDPLAIVFFEWKSMFKRAAKAGSLTNSIKYFIKAPGWSHNGSSKTVKQMRQLASSRRPSYGEDNINIAHFPQLIQDLTPSPPQTQSPTHSFFLSPPTKLPAIYHAAKRSGADDGGDVKTFRLSKMLAQETSASGDQQWMRNINV